MFIYMGIVNTGVEGDKLGESKSENIQFICENDACYIIATAYKNRQIKRSTINKVNGYLCCTFENNKRFKFIEGEAYYLDLSFDKGMPVIKTQYESLEFVPFNHRPQIGKLNKFIWMELGLSEEPLLHDDYYGDEYWANVKNAAYNTNSASDKYDCGDYFTDTLSSTRLADYLEYEDKIYELANEEDQEKNIIQWDKRPQYKRETQ